MFFCYMHVHRLVRAKWGGIQPIKFKFIRKELAFAGFMVTGDEGSPTKKMLEVIANFTELVNLTSTRA